MPHHGALAQLLWLPALLHLRRAMLHIDSVAVHMAEVSKDGRMYSVSCWDCYWARQKAQGGYKDDESFEFRIPDTDRAAELLQEEWEDWVRGID